MDAAVFCPCRLSDGPFGSAVRNSDDDAPAQVYLRLVRCENMQVLGLVTMAYPVAQLYPRVKMSKYVKLSVLHEIYRDVTGQSGSKECAMYSMMVLEF